VTPDIGAPTESGIPSTRLPRKLFAWSLIDQSVSSAVTFLFTVIAGRSLGPSGLGIVAIGQATYFIALGFTRSLIVAPLLTRLSASSRTAKQAFRSATSVTVAGGAGFALLTAMSGLVAPGPVARSMLIFAPWIVPSLLQDVVRSWLYRKGNARRACGASTVWLITMLAVMAAGLRYTDWQIAAAWGIGASASFAAAATGTADSGLGRPRAAAAWFRDEAARLGGWLALSGVVYGIATYVRLAAFSSILGTSAVGGFRAIETAFSPTTLVSPALSNPGLPTLRDAVERNPSRAWALGIRISLLALALTLAFVTVVILARDLVFRVLGEEFRQYEALIWPIAFGQLVTASMTGIGLVLTAARRVKNLAVLVTFNSILSVALSVPMAVLGGLEGAAWGLALAGVPPAVLTAVFARRALFPEAHPTRSSTTDVNRP
jgi:O-antigen/teichoic acid export membrane protein